MYQFLHRVFPDDFDYIFFDYFLIQITQQEHDDVQQSFEMAQRQFAELQRQNKTQEQEITDLMRDKQEQLHRCISCV